MIFGKKDEEATDVGQWHWRFAYLPVPIYDGRWIWWEKYLYRFSCGHPDNGLGVYLSPQPQRRLDMPPPRTETPPPPRK